MKISSYATKATPVDKHDEMTLVTNDRMTN